MRVNLTSNWVIKNVHENFLPSEMESHTLPWQQRNSFIYETLMINRLKNGNMREKNYVYFHEILADSQLRHRFGWVQFTQRRCAEKREPEVSHG